MSPAPDAVRIFEQRMKKPRPVGRGWLMTTDWLRDAEFV
jgi:hypothetical protein